MAITGISLTTQYILPPCTISLLFPLPPPGRRNSLLSKRDGFILLLFPAKLHPKDALQLAENLLVRDRLARLVLLYDLWLFVDLLGKLCLRELLCKATLLDGLLHFGIHRGMRQLLRLQVEFQRILVGAPLDVASGVVCKEGQEQMTRKGKEG